MKIGLIDVDSKMPNLALMKISTYHKQRCYGDQVDWAFPINYKEFDKLYASSIFDCSDKTWVSKDAVCGGTGYDYKSWLSDVIDKCDPDYSIYPKCKFSIQRFSRGCIRKCPYCVVWRMTGFQSLTPMELNPSGLWIYVMDDNFFANPFWKESLLILGGCGQPVHFDGIDVRLLDEEKCRLLSEIKLKTQIHMAWDNPKDNLIKKFKEVIQWLPSHKIMVYVLIGYWSTPEEDLWRVEELNGLGIDPFVMPYDKHNNYQKHFARWVNHKAVFNSVEWKDYKNINKEKK